MQIYVIAPFRCHFGLRDSQSAHHDADYISFAESLQNWLSPEFILEAYPRIDHIEVHHQNPKSTTLKYWNMNDDGSTPLPHVLTIIPKQTEPFRQLSNAICGTLSSSEFNGSSLRLSEGSVAFRIFDNTVGFIEFIIEVDSNWCLDDPASSFAAITQCTNSLAQEIVSSYYTDCLFPLLRDLADRDTEGRFIDPIGDYDNFPEMALPTSKRGSSLGLPAIGPAGKVLWANRSACVPRTECEKTVAWLDVWAPLGGADELKEELHVSSSVFVGWGHSVFRVPFDCEESLAAIKAIRLAQYFYTVLFIINENLSRFIGHSLSPHKHEELRDIQRRMKDVAPSVDLLVATYIDTQQTIQGLSRNFFLTASRRYSTDDVVQNIERKTKTVNNLIQRAFERSTRRTQLILEMLVFALGGLTLIDLTLNLTSVAHSERLANFVRSHGSDGVPGLLDLGSVFPADALLWLSSTALGLVLAFYFFLFVKRN